MRHKQQTIQISEYPEGTFIKTEKGYFYVVSDVKRYRFTTSRVLDSWAPQRIIETTENNPAVKRLRIAAKMKFRNGSLLYCQADGKMYLVSNKKVRHIKSPDILTGLSMKRKDAVWVSEDEIKLHEEGEPLS
jgi:hypothetical protein